MPYIKPKPQQLEHLASASAYDNHKPLQTGEGKTDSIVENSESLIAPSSGKGVTEIIIMDKTVIHIYPDGSKHLQKHLCQKWIAGMQQVYKQKAKEKQDKKKDLEEIKIVEGESY